MGMLKGLVQQLQAQFAVTPVTPVFRAGVPAKPSIHAGCTPVTPVTPKINKGGGAFAKPPVPAPIPAPAHAPARAANDTTLQDWHALDTAYLLHHAGCIQCKAAGRGRGERCAAGAAQWLAYEAVPPPWAVDQDKTITRGNGPYRSKRQQLYAAAMRACDFWGDGEDGRQAMRDWCDTLPTDDWQKAIDYFREHYPAQEDSND